MNELFVEIDQSLRQGDELVLATIISEAGSTPRNSGTRMIVYRNGRISGTIGGGAVEADVIDNALNLFDRRGAIISSYDLNWNGNAAQMDLICGGCLQILLEHVPADEKNIYFYGIAAEAIRLSRPFSLVGELREDGGHLRVDRAIKTGSRNWVGSLQIEPQLKLILERDHLGDGRCTVVAMGGQSYIVESILPSDTVYLVGGGHVSKEIAALTKLVGFKTRIFDDRVEFANAERFPGVDEIHVCPDFDKLFAKFTIDKDSYIIIATRGHHFDKEVLAQALHTGAGYIGMIGSRRKKAGIYQVLINEGYKQSALDQVHCPIGIAIEAETPAEIAISVIAELIQHRAGRKNRG